MNANAHWRLFGSLSGVHLVPLGIPRGTKWSLEHPKTSQRETPMNANVHWRLFGSLSGLHLVPLGIPTGIKWSLEHPKTSQRETPMLRTSLKKSKKKRQAIALAHRSLTAGRHIRKAFKQISPPSHPTPPRASLLSAEVGSYGTHHMQQPIMDQ